MLSIVLFTLFILQAPAVWSHGIVTKITFDGVDYPAWSSDTSPVSIERKIDNNGPIDYTKPIIATGEGQKAMENDKKNPVITAAVKGGSTVTFTWDTWPSNHLGPIMNYMAACNGDCTGIVGSTLDWFKIEQTNYNPITKIWPTTTLSQTWKYSFKIPNDIPSGQYLLRHELLALYSTGDPQFWPRVVQIDLTTNGGKAPTITGKFPEMYSANNLGFKTWNIYNDDNSLFVPPGIAVYNAAPSPDTVVTSADTVAGTSTAIPPTEIPAAATSSDAVVAGTSAAVPSTEIPAAATSSAAVAAGTSTAIPSEETPAAATSSAAAVATSSAAIPSEETPAAATSSPAATVVAPGTTSAADTSIAGAVTTEVAPPASSTAASSASASPTRTVCKRKRNFRRM